MALLLIQPGSLPLLVPDDVEAGAAAHPQGSGTAEQGGGLLSSYSNDGESGTFDLSQSSYTEEGKSKKEREIIYKYLGNTGLLYRGMQL